MTVTLVLGRRGRAPNLLKALAQGSEDSFLEFFSVFEIFLGLWEYRFLWDCLRRQIFELVENCDFWDSRFWDPIFDLENCEFRELWFLRSAGLLDWWFLRCEDCLRVVDFLLLNVPVVFRSYHYSVQNHLLTYDHSAMRTNPAWIAVKFICMILG